MQLFFVVTDEGQSLPLSVDVWQVLWRSSEVFPVELAEVQLLWLHVPACTSTTKRHKDRLRVSQHPYMQTKKKCQG